MCLHKYINTACWICSWSLCSCGFRDSHFILDNQLGDACLGEADSPSNSSHWLLVAPYTGLWLCENFPRLCYHIYWLFRSDLFSSSWEKLCQTSGIPHPLLWCSLSHRYKGLWNSWAGFPTICWSLHCIQWWFFVNVSIFCKSKLLWWVVLSKLNIWRFGSGNCQGDGTCGICLFLVWVHNTKNFFLGPSVHLQIPDFISLHLYLVALHCVYVPLFQYTSLSKYI